MRAARTVDLSSATSYVREPFALDRLIARIISELGKRV